MSDEKIVTHQDVIDALHEEIAALKAERDRARAELISMWAEPPRYPSTLVDAEARYKREIAQEDGK